MPTYPDISKITLPTGSTYNVKDQEARDLIAALEKKGKYLGKTTTDISDNSTTNPITVVIEGTPTQVTAIEGDWAIYDKYDGQTMVGTIESIWNGTTWQEFGDLSDMGSLAYKDSASGLYTPTGTVSQSTFTGSQGSVAITASADANGNYTPAGTVSQPSFTGTSTTSTGKFTPTGSVSLTDTNKTATVSAAQSGDTTYQPSGSVSTPTISVKTAGSTTTVNSITDVGTLPSATMPTYSVSNETLTITAGSFNAGTLPTKGANQTVKTGDAAYESTQPTFSGTAVRLVTDNIAVPTSASFSGNEGNVSVTGTPSGTVSQPSFSGTKVQISGTTTPSGTVSQPTFTGDEATITVS